MNQSNKGMEALIRREIDHARAGRPGRGELVPVLCELPPRIPSAGLGEARTGPQAISEERCPVQRIVAGG